MAYCTKCGKQNEDDAAYCTTCGATILDSAPTEPSKDKVERIIEQTTQRISEGAEDVGKRFEQAMERAGTRVETWYTRTFGIFGPLVSSFVGLIILRLIIEFFRIAGDDLDVFRIIGDALFMNLILIFGIMLLSGYTDYEAKRNHAFRWIQPITTGIVVVFVIWLITTILVSIGNEIGIPEFADGVVRWANDNLLLIFILIILLGYFILLANMNSDKYRKKKQQ